MIKSILKIHLLSLSIFTIFRFILLFSNTEHWQGVSSDVFQALLMGLRFDTVINSYILSLPSLVWAIMYCIGKNNRLINRFLYVYCVVLFSLAYVISGFDIPYFNQFFSRFDKVAFQWIENPEFIIEMAIRDFRLWGYFIPFVLLMVVFHYFLRKIFRKVDEIKFQTRKIYWKIPISLLFLGLTFLGIRGRIEKKSPIRVGTAYFSNNAFLNKLGLNPNFTLIDSFLQKDVVWKELIPTNQALQMVRNDFGIIENHQNPIAQSMKPDSLNLGKPNIVLILMESMTANNMKYFGSDRTLTPFLDGLIQKSIFFENTYSAGIHTFNGIFSSLMSYPALWAENPMKNIKNYNSGAKILSENGYITNYFTTHDGQFDNIEGFLMGNNYHRVYAQKDYPSSEVKSNLGVTDDYMLRYSIDKMNDMHKTGKPFFSVLMTASNHAPIIIPEYFKSRYNNDNESHKVIEYSDWALEQFIKQAEKQEWFRNTIFVFMADHGAGFDTTYEMSISYNHIPLFFYAPHLLKKNEIRSDFVQQIDVLPSILGLTDISYTKENLGINIWQQKRPFAYFGADDKIGVVNDEFYFIYHKDGREGLYKYRNKDLTNYISQYPDLAKKMKNYAFSNMQTAHYLSSKLK